MCIQKHVTTTQSTFAFNIYITQTTHCLSLIHNPLPWRIFMLCLNVRTMDCLKYLNVTKYSWNSFFTGKRSHLHICIKFEISPILHYRLHNSKACTKIQSQTICHSCCTAWMHWFISHNPTPFYLNVELTLGGKNDLLKIFLLKMTECESFTNKKCIPSYNIIYQKWTRNVFF